MYLTDVRTLHACVYADELILGRLEQNGLNILLISGDVSNPMTSSIIWKS